MRNLVSSYGLLTTESDEQLVAMLAPFNEKTLLLVLPYAGYARRRIFQAMEWLDIVPLQQQIFAIGRCTSDEADYVQDVSNCESTMSGVIDRGLLQEVLQQADDKRVSKYLKALRASSLELSNILMLVSALAGLDRDKVEKKLVRHAQTAIKAYGLYAVESDEELRARYLQFKTMHKEATKYGSERQANTQAAVKAGIKNLAQAAGYTDDTRLEWAMEADIASQMVPFDQHFEVEAWQVCLVLEGITPISKASWPIIEFTSAVV